VIAVRADQGRLLSSSEFADAAPPGGRVDRTVWDTVQVLRCLFDGDGCSARCAVRLKEREHGVEEGIGGFFGDEVAAVRDDDGGHVAGE
jgi:hypothetical protein